MKGTKGRTWSIRSCWCKLRQSALQSALLLWRMQDLWCRHLMLRQVHRHLPLLLIFPELLTLGSTRLVEALMALVVMGERALTSKVVMGEKALLVRGE